MTDEAQIAALDDWHPEDIKAAVRKQGSTLAAIGRLAGMSRQSIALALVRPNEKGEDAIARYLGLKAQVIWPSRYHANGRRRRPQPAENYHPEPRFAVCEAQI
ncbi:MAG TPA: helix-turn-helix transcriptional regulator [Allosphingosinicella sp.]